MNSKFESFKDFLYEAIDYFMILIIILIVAGVIGWRLDILFSESNNTEIDSKVEVSKESKESIDNLKDKNKEFPTDSNTKTEGKESSKEKREENSDKKESQKKQENKESNSTITITIPDGANSSSIGDILKDKGIIDNSSDFISKSEEMNLSTKLKSGTFTLDSGDSLEEVIKKITK